MNRDLAMPQSIRPALHRLSLRAALLGCVLAPLQPAISWAQPAERAAAATARGDLRNAQLEWRNAVRQDPAATASRVALAEISLELGDGETAEREARAALRIGYDQAAGTALLMRAFLVSGRFDELLREFAMPDQAGATPAQPSPITPATAAQVAAGRGLAYLALRQLPEARAAIATAQLLAPQAAEPDLAAIALLLSEGDRRAAEPIIDALLQRQPNNVEALLRKGGLLFERNEPRLALERFDLAVGVAPGNVLARMRRGETLLLLGEPARAQLDIDAALAVVPGSPPALFLRAMLLAGAQNWAGVDEVLQRIGPQLGNLSDGFLLMATAKRRLGQLAQAEDAARRHLARRPEDPRGARLVAIFDMEANRFDDATAVLTRLQERGGADALALDMLGRLHSAAGRRAEAVAAFAAASALAPQDAGLMSRLAAARLAGGDVAGTLSAAGDALRLNPQSPGVREMLAFAALFRGDIAAVGNELDQLSPAAKRGEAAGLLAGTTRLMRMELPQARAAFQAVLQEHPGSVAGRLWLARVARIQGQPAEVERLLGEVLRAEPGNIEAAGLLAAAALPGQPRAAEARATLQAAQSAAPAQLSLAQTMANLHIRAGEAIMAVGILTAPELQSQPGAAFALAEAHAAAGDWPAAETASRRALAEAPASTPARRQLAALLLRGGDARGAEALIEQGLRERPADGSLQQTLVAIIRQSRGIEPALEAASRLAGRADAQPAAAQLPGDLLVVAQRLPEAVKAYEQALVATPSSALALRHAAALHANGQADAAAAALRAWLERMAQDDEAGLLLSQFDIQAGRLEEAERRLDGIVARRADDPVALNNLAWVLGERGGEAASGRARALAERAYFLAPGPDVADTLGWILARSGQPAQAVPLLRQSAAARATPRPDPAAAYRLAFALNAAGEREQARQVLTPVLAEAPAFPGRAEAERLLAELNQQR